MKYRTISHLSDLEDSVMNNDAVLVYFSHEKCNVCKVLKPKIAEMINSKFTKIELIYVDTTNSPDIAGQYSIFSVPTLVSFFSGRETFRKSRNIGLTELESELLRPYNMIFED